MFHFLLTEQDFILHYIPVFKLILLAKYNFVEIDKIWEKRFYQLLD